ncbi:MAG: NusG domain II-containing protein [Treponema sp.]|jgi:hypothetical protein|nr:NusG domain II-containing protein [Treponema sp.]
MKGAAALKPFDLAAIGLALGITVLSALVIYADEGSQNRIVIKGEGATWVFPQDGAEIVPVPGPLGDTMVEVRDRRVRVLASPCSNQTCVAAGAIQSHGQWLACLPNKVLISIEGASVSNGEAIDAAVW